VLYLVKPGGHVFFSTINRNPKAYAFAILGAEYILRILPRGTHEYEKFIKPSELAGGIRNTDLDMNDMTGLHYNPITQRYWLGPNVDVNYMVATRRVADEELMQMHSPQAVLFDLDGTLIDTAPDFAAVLNRQLAAHGRSTIPIQGGACRRLARARVRCGIGVQ
jgi:hypothetical protein